MSRKEAKDILGRPSLKTPCYILVGTDKKGKVKAIRFKTGDPFSHNIGEAAKRLKCPNVDMYRVRLNVTKWQYPTLIAIIMKDGELQ